MKASNGEGAEALAEPFWGEKPLTFGVDTVQQAPAHAGVHYCPLKASCCQEVQRVHIPCNPLPCHSPHLPAIQGSKARLSSQLTPKVHETAPFPPPVA